MAFGISYHKSNRASRGIIVATQWRPCGDLVAATATLPLRPAALPLPTLCHCCCSATPALLPCHSCPLLPCQPAHSALLPCHCCPSTAALPLLLSATAAALHSRLATPPHCPVCSATVPLISIVAASRRTVANRKSAANCSIMHKQQSLQRLGERLSLYGIFYGEDCGLLR